MYYIYECSVCKIQKEKKHGMNESPEYFCCGTKMKRLVTGGSGFVLKGLGWDTKGTATAPKPKKVIEHVLMGPKFMKPAFTKG